MKTNRSILLSLPHQQRNSQKAEIRLVDLPIGTRAKILHIDRDSAHEVYGFGIYPGLEILLKQKFPLYVIQCDEMEVALESNLARSIWIEPAGE